VFEKGDEGSVHKSVGKKDVYIFYVVGPCNVGYANDSTRICSLCSCSIREATASCLQI
jgi:hypothetical protein